MAPLEHSEQLPTPQMEGVGRTGPILPDLIQEHIPPYPLPAPNLCFPASFGIHPSLTALSTTGPALPMKHLFPSYRLVHLASKYLLSANYVLGTILGTENTGTEQS